MNSTKTLIASLILLPLVSTYGDNVILDDLIVDGSACVGSDCANGENFGFDTLRLKENNLRIKFEDTSSSGSFPSNDWQLTANDSGNGGANKFSIDDVDGGKTPFTIEAGSPNNLLYVDSTGRVGIGKANPSVLLHTVDGNTPALRLEQDGSDGWTAQTWDVAGNEASFFIRDITHSSKLPFRIQPGSAGSSLYIRSVGVSFGADVGIGTGSTAPAASLEIQKNDGADLLIKDTSSTLAERTLLKLENKGASEISATNTSTNGTWTTSYDADVTFSHSSSSMQFAVGSSGAISMKNADGDTIFILDDEGNLTTLGTVNGASDRNIKENFEPVSSQEILEKVASIPVKKWNYIGNDVTHIGPMAQDVWAQFQVGQGDTTISMVDADGIAMASIQALYQNQTALEAELKELQQENDELAGRVERLEALLHQMVGGDQL